MDFETIKKQSLDLHRRVRGKIEVKSKVPVTNGAELALAYTPGVGAVSSYVAAHPDEVRDYTGKGNFVAVVSDGSAVLGLGNIGPLGALPVMEGKCVLFKQFAGIDAVPIVLATQDPDEVVRAVQAIAPTFGGINLEDISAPRCFAIEERLKATLDIPVMHDDQHGTAIVVLAGVLNALRVVGKQLANVRIVVSGAGAAGTAITLLLLRAGARDVTVMDRAGALVATRAGLSPEKQALALRTNPQGRSGVLAEVLRGADLVIGVSGPRIITEGMVANMASGAIVFALANPIPEIAPDAALRAGARVVATGRSDFPNQLNNALAFPGVFRGALANGVRAITDDMKLAAAHALAGLVPDPAPELIIPSVFDERVVPAISGAIR